MYRTLKEGETRQELEKITVRSLYLESYTKKNPQTSQYVCDWSCIALTVELANSSVC